MSEQNIVMVRTAYEALEAGNAEGIFKDFAPEIDWREADGFPYSDRNPYRTVAEVAEGVLGRLGTEWEGFGAHPEQFMAGGDQVAVFGRYAGTYKATGKSIDVPMVHLWTIRDGKIVAFRQYTDTALVQAALK